MVQLRFDILLRLCGHPLRTQHASEINSLAQEKNDGDSSGQIETIQPHLLSQASKQSCPEAVISYGDLNDIPCLWIRDAHSMSLEQL
jgi:hypothetical protein